jgi:tetratricopeptide (TPR) repeat protein
MAEALPLYDFLVKSDNKNADFYVSRGIVKQHLGNFDGSTLDFIKAIEIDPKSGKAYYSRAYTAFLQKDYDAAMDDVNKALLINENDDEAYFIRANIKGTQAITGERCWITTVRPL